MLALFPTAVSAVLLVACGLIIVAHMQKRLIETWVAAGSQSGTFAPEFSYHLRQWSKEFGLWHDIQRVAMVVIASCLITLLAYVSGIIV